MVKDRAILYLAIGQTLVWAGLSYVFPAMLVRWEAALGWSKAELTGAVTLALFLSAVASPPAGRLIDADKGALLMAGCTALGGLSLFALSAVTELWQFYAVWAVIGVLAAGCLYEPCFALVTRARGTAARRGIIVITLVAGFASSISFPAAHYLSESYGWRPAMQIFAVVVIFLATPFMWLGARQVERSGQAGKTDKIDVEASRYAFLRRYAFWFLALAFALAAVLHRTTLYHLLPILHDRGIRPEIAVLAASFIGPMQVVGRLVMMVVEKRVSNHGVALACFAGMGISILLLMWSGSTAAMLVSFVILFGGAYGTASIIRPLTARDILGETNFGAKTGALALLFLAGSATAPYLGSIVWAIGGYKLVLCGLVGLAIVGFGLYSAAHRSARAS